MRSIANDKLIAKQLNWPVTAASVFLCHQMIVCQESKNDMRRLVNMMVDPVARCSEVT